MFWYWLPVGAAILLVWASLRGERKRAAYVARRLSEAESSEWLPPVSVIVPVKGQDHGLRENLAALSSLDYPDYELIVAAHSAADIPAGVLPARARVVLAHGDDPETAEKVQNLQAATRATRKRTDIFAFADSDGCVTRKWLRALVAPLAEEGVGASTGFRWFTPVPPTFWSLMRGVWDAVALSSLGPGDNPFAWGGAMAIRKQVFFDTNVPEFWKKTISDDYGLARAVHAGGLRIAWAPGALTPSFEPTGALQFFGWARRQMMITRTYGKRLWRLGLMAHVLYSGAMLASVVASIQGHRLAEWALIAQLSPGMLKALNRATLAKACLPEHEDWFRRHAWVHPIWSPLATLLWLWTLTASAFGSTIEWRGRRYRLHKRL